MAKSLDRILIAAGAATALPSVHDALDAWRSTRIEHGYVPLTPNLLGEPDVNAKVRKNEVPTWTLTLAPASTSLVVNACDKSTAQCRKACVMWTAGRGQTLSVRAGRIVRTAFAATHPEHFLALLGHEVRNLEKRGVPFGLRLNVASDIRWEAVAPELFWGSNARAYDYTKWGADDRFDWQANYRLTYSHSERWSDEDVHAYVEVGKNVAMVFDTPKHMLPTHWQGLPVIDGDLSDYRYDDPRGVIVGLAAKGAAKHMKAGGFVTAA